MILLSNLPTAQITSAPASARRRQNVLDTIIHKIQDIPSLTNLLILWGSPGIGKTWMLNQIQDNCRQQDIICHTIDFGVYADRVGAAFRSQIAGVLAEMVTGQIADTSLSSNEVMKQVVAALESKRCVILLDNLDTVLRRDEDSFFWMEWVLVAPILISGSPIIGTSSTQIQLQWRDYDVRRRCASYHLRPLSREEVASALKWSDPAAIEDAFSACCGHPQVMQWYHEMSGEDERQIARATRTECEMRQRELWSRAAVFFLKGLEGEFHILAQTVSLLYWFNVSFLRKLGLDAEPHDDSFYLSQISRLNRAGLTAWGMNRGAYRFTDPSVRQILRLNFKLTDPDPNRSRDIHRTAFEHYSGETKYEDYLDEMLPQALYHLAEWKLADGASPEQAGQDCMEWLTQTSHPSWEKADWTVVQHAFELPGESTIENKAKDSSEQEDSEVQIQIIRELKQLIGDSAFADILRFVNGHSRLEAHA